jgi:hypothetical protein
MGDAAESPSPFAHGDFAAAGDPFKIFESFFGEFNDGGANFRSFRFNGGSPFQQQHGNGRWDAIAPGTVVLLKGLVSQPGLNGTSGQVQGGEAGAYTVRLQGNAYVRVEAEFLLQLVQVRLPPVPVSYTGISQDCFPVHF